MNNKTVLELKNISKIFPGVKALDQVSFDVRAGEIHALVGENGAGKSTLINIISGVLKPSEGSIAIDGKEIEFHSPQDAFKSGIGVVHQERNLIREFSVGENLCFNYITEKATGFVNKKEMKEITDRALAAVKMDISPDESVKALSSGTQQMLEIARALTLDSKVLLLDEPTASISQAEVRVLLDTVIELKKKGISIIYISHKLEEVLEIADRITVIRDGKKIGETIEASGVSREKLIELMVGRKTEETKLKARDLREKEIVIRVEEVCSKNNPNRNSFVLHKGEVLGWYGLVGAGRTELAREIIGIDPVTEGRIEINGETAKITSFRQSIRKYGLYYISENRKEEGLFLSHSIGTNIVVSAMDKIKSSLGCISYKKKDMFSLDYLKKLQIKANDAEIKVQTLSGGNQQKVCIAKGLATDPSIVIIDEPTVGIDIKTKTEIHNLIRELAESGLSVIVISSDLMEIIQISDRVIVFNEGSAVAEVMNTNDYKDMSTDIMKHVVN